MTTQTKRPKARQNDIAYVPSANLFGMPLFRITDLEVDAAGNVTAYFLSDLTNPGPGARVDAGRVAGVFSNILTQE